jgi:hypothetical protein
MLVAMIFGSSHTNSNSAGASVQAITVSPGTSGQILAAVKQAASGGPIPKNLQPDLSNFVSTLSTYRSTGVSLLAPCSPNLTSHLSQVSMPVACKFGNLSSPKTIVIYGDSNVGNWFPALSLGLATSAFKLVVYSFAGCPSADITYTTAMLGSQGMASACNTWHSNVEQQIRTIKPAAVIVASSYELVSMKDSVWANGISKFFTSAAGNAPLTKRIIMGTTPFFRSPVGSCLSIAKTLSSCALDVRQKYASIISNRDPLAARLSNAKTIPTNQWFCYGFVCPAVVNGIVVAADHDHLTQEESTYLSSVATSAVLKAAS